MEPPDVERAGSSHSYTHNTQMSSDIKNDLILFVHMLVAVTAHQEALILSSAARVSALTFSRR